MKNMDYKNGVATPNIQIEPRICGIDIRVECGICAVQRRPLSLARGISCWHRLQRCGTSAGYAARGCLDSLVPKVGLWERKCRGEAVLRGERRRPRPTAAQ